MANKKEKPIVDNEVGKLKVKKQPEVQPTGNETKGNVTKVKTKMTMKPKVEEESVTKVDLSKPIKPEENEVKENNTNDEGVVTELTNADTPQKQEEIQPETETQETPTLEEVTKENPEAIKEIAEEVEEVIAESIETGKPLPEGIEKLIEFMDETGGDLNDYVTLNQDYSQFNDQDLLYEYYRQTKPHLNTEEINFLMEASFSYDEEEDEDIDIRRKKLALKEQVASAKTHLEGHKSRYYEEIKAGSKLTQEQQKAVNFFNRYNKESEEQEKQAEYLQSTFVNQTDKVFDNNFKGFDFNVGDKKFRYNVKDPNQVKANQSDLNNFIGKFLGENAEMKDAKGYHKSLFTAMNADTIANHFYEQGRADAMKDSVAKSKNIDMNPRQAHGEIQGGGFKARVLGDNTSDFKFKINKNRK